MTWSLELTLTKNDSTPGCKTRSVYVRMYVSACVCDSTIVNTNLDVIQKYVSETVSTYRREGWGGQGAFMPACQLVRVSSS